MSRNTPHTITLGIERLLVDPPAWLEGKRIGLLCNQASTDASFVHSRDLIRHAFPGRLTCIFTPQHGFFAEKQDNMIESDHCVDSVSGLPVFSLYADKRRPLKSMCDHFDVLLIDLVDVGTRVYTFLYTVAYCMEAAAEFGKKVVVLDRPNPIGGEGIEGNLLQEDCSSFVGLYPIPMRHGMTLGELALMINSRFGVNADLEVISMQGWKRSMLFRETGLPWVFPSPNMPTPETALVYPGQVIWEGTNISEGRGTTLPFELFGAPFFSHGRILKRLEEVSLPGCMLRPVVFEPTSNKWSGKACSGFHLHVTDPLRFRPYRTTLALLQAAMLEFPEDFACTEPPYEYEYERLPLDLILGDRSVLQSLKDGVHVLELEKGWEEDLKEFSEMRRKYLLYA